MRADRRCLGRHGASVDVTSLTNVSTLPSTVSASVEVMHRPAAVALPYAVENLAAAATRQLDRPAVLFFPTALAWHVSFAAAFLPAASSSFDVHLLAAPEPFTSVESRSFTKPSTLPSMVPAVVGVRQSPALVALLYAAKNFSSAIMRHPEPTASPFATVFARHFVFARAFFPAAESSCAVHLLFFGGAVVVVVAVVTVVVVVLTGVHAPKLPTPPALLVGVGQARMKSAVLLPVPALRVRL